MSIARQASKAPLPLNQRRRRIIIAYSFYFVLAACFFIGWLGNIEILKHAAIALSLFPSRYLTPLDAGWWNAQKYKNPHFDERQEQRLGWAYATAFKATNALLSCGAVLLFLASILHVQAPKLTLQEGALFIGGSIFMLNALPTALLAWTEPDLDSE